MRTRRGRSSRGNASAIGCSKSKSVCAPMESLAPAWSTITDHVTTLVRSDRFGGEILTISDIFG